MKRTVGVLLIGAVAWIGVTAPAHAQVASSYNAPVQESSAAKPLAGYDNGFFMRSADDEFRLQVMTRVQFQYQYQQIQGLPDTSSFFLRRARLIFIGTAFKNFDFMSYANYATSTAAVNAPSWYGDVTAHIIPAFNLQVGTVSTPLSGTGEGSSGTAAFVGDSLTSSQEDGVKDKTIARQAFDTPLSIGVRAFGDVKRFHYIVGVTNGDTNTAFNASKQFSYGARVRVDLLDDPGSAEMDLAYSEKPAWAIGAGTSYDGQDAAVTSVRATPAVVDWSWVSAADSLFKWRGFTLLTEGYLRKNKITTGNFTLDDFGYLMQAGYFVVPKKFEVVGRAAQIFREGPDNDAYEFAGGLNWYIHGNNVKLQTDVSRLLDFDATAGTGGQTTWRYRAQLQLSI